MKFIERIKSTFTKLSDWITFQDRDVKLIKPKMTDGYLNRKRYPIKPLPYRHMFSHKANHCPYCDGPVDYEFGHAYVVDERTYPESYNEEFYITPGPKSELKRSWQELRKCPHCWNYFIVDRFHKIC